MRIYVCCHMPNQFFMCVFKQTASSLKEGQCHITLVLNISKFDLKIAYLHKCKTDSFHSYEGKKAHQGNEDIQNSETLQKQQNYF